MADTVDQILKSLDIDSIDPTLILYSIKSQNENLQKQENMSVSGVTPDKALNA